MEDEMIIEQSPTVQDIEADGKEFFEGDFFDYIGSSLDDSNQNQGMDQGVDSSYQDSPTDQQNTENTSIKPQGETFTFEEYFQTPEQFETHEEALQWYQERMNTMKTELMNPDNPLTQEYINNYVANRLDEEDELIGGFKEAYNALLKNPKEYLIQFVPEVLQEYGIEPVLSMEQMDMMVDKQLRAEFGDDYKQRWNSNELLDLGSFTSKVLSRRNEVVNHLDGVNRKNQEIMNNWNKNIAEGKSNVQNLQTQSVEEQMSTIKQQYGSKFIKEYGMSEQAFDSFLQEASNRELTLEDLHRVQYFEGYMKQAYEKGLGDAKKGLYNKLNQEQNAVKPMETKKSTPTVKRSNVLNSVLNGRMHIPNY